MPKNERTLILKSNAPELAKKKLILSEMVKLRINLYDAYLDQIQLCHKGKDDAKAVKLMNDYVETVAIPFMLPLRQLSLFGRLKKWLSRDKTPTPSELIEKWRTEYKQWFHQKSSTYHDFYERERIKEVNHLQSTFNLLYAYSFSKDNNPESQTFVFVDPTKIKL